MALWHLADRGRGTPLQTFLALLPLFIAVPIYLVWYPWAYRRNLRRTVAGMVSGSLPVGGFTATPHTGDISE